MLDGTDMGIDEEKKQLITGGFHAVIGLLIRFKLMVDLGNGRPKMRLPSSSTLDVMPRTISCIL